ncbi:phospholipase-like protein [Tanacetum coccineum]
MMNTHPTPDVKISVRSSVKLLPEIEGLLLMKSNHERKTFGKGEISKKWWSKKANVIPRGLAWSKVTTFEKSDYEELFGPMSNPNVALISSPEEMSQAWFKASAEFIKGLDDQDGTFFQDDQGREKCMEQHNGMCGDTEDGTFVDRVVGKICPKMNRMSVDDGDGVLDSQSDDGDGVLDSQTKDVIEEAAMLPTMSRKDDEFDELTKRFSKLETSETFVKFKKLLTNDLCTENESSDCNPKKSDGGVSIEEKPNFSSHHNDSSNHIGGVSSEANEMFYMWIDIEQQANADKGKTTVIQETVRVIVEERPSLGRGLGTLKFKKKNCKRALRPNYVLSLKYVLELYQFYIHCWAGGSRRRWWRRMKKVLPEKLTLYLLMHGIFDSKGISADDYKITYNYASVPFQASLYGDCGIWVCIFIYRLCRNLPVAVDNDPLETALAYRERMLEFFWNHKILVE